jgi:acyl-CoA synthetase (AMP-forming)/AMP-acid ligase II
MDAPRANPLYHRWLEVAASGGATLAVREVAGGRDWSFAQLRELAAQAAPCPPLLHSSARGLGLIVDVLRAWRDGTVLLADDGSGVPAPSPAMLQPGVCHLKVTSGSTGPPRHVQFRPEQLAADAAQIVATMGLRPDWPNLGLISMAHSYGFSNLVLPLLLHGVPLWLLDNPLPETLRRVLDTPQPLTLAAVPAMWQAWDRVGLDFTPVRLAISAGAPLPVALEAAVFARTGLKIHNFYGSSECGGIAYDRTSEPRTQATLAGTPMAGVTFACDPASACLRITSAAVAEGYVAAGPGADAAAKTVSLAGGQASRLSGPTGGPPVGSSADRRDALSSLTGGTPVFLSRSAKLPVLDAAAGPGEGTWLAQDLVRIDEQGAVHLLGRAGDFISVAGHKFSPTLIEDVLRRVPGVRHCVVFGVPSANEIRVEDVVACVNLTDETDLHLLKSAFTALPSTYCPRHWWRCDDLHPDARGKLSRSRWRERWLAQAAGGTPPQ